MVEFFNNAIYINGEKLIGFKKFSDGYEIARFIIGKDKFSRDEMKNFCDENDIPESVFDVYMSYINSKCKSKFGEKLILSTYGKFNKIYWVNPNLAGDVFVILKLPKEIWAKYEKELKEYQINTNKGDGYEF